MGDPYRTLVGNTAGAGSIDDIVITWPFYTRFSWCQSIILLSCSKICCKLSDMRRLLKPQEMTINDLEGGRGNQEKYLRPFSRKKKIEGLLQELLMSRTRKNYFTKGVPGEKSFRNFPCPDH